MHTPLPDWLDAVFTLVAALATFVGATGVLARFRGTRWVWRKLVTDPITGWFRNEVAEVVTAELAPMKARLAEIQREVTPNGGKSDRLGDRMKRVEEAVVDKS